MKELPSLRQLVWSSKIERLKLCLKQEKLKLLMLHLLLTRKVAKLLLQRKRILQKRTIKREDQLLRKKKLRLKD